MRKCPGKGKRTKSKSRIDVERTNRNRVTVRREELTISADEGSQRTRIRSKATGIEDFSELVDSNVLLPAGRQTLTIRCRKQRQLRSIQHLAGRYNIRLKLVQEDPNGTLLDASGSPDDCMDFCNHVAGHRDLRTVTVDLVTSAMESTGTDSHVRDAMRFGLTAKPKRVDYSAGRNQPKGTYSTDDRYSVNDIDHIDCRNDGRRAGMRAPDIPHTEH